MSLFFFLSDAFLKEDNSYFSSARESYAQKDFGMTSFFLNKILTDEKKVIVGITF